MSLFKTRDWWSVAVGENETFGQGCLALANIDNEVNSSDKIIVGSYQGILRIFNPRTKKTEDGCGGFSVDDLVLEQVLHQPILQLEAGRFSSVSENLVLAILHPRKLCVYNISAISGTVAHGDHCRCVMLYEHSLQRSAFQFCYGPFGAVKDRDFICVQSMDGTLCIIEQESFAFTCFLPGALLPGPIRYLSRQDSFITLSSEWRVESYRYHALSMATNSQKTDECVGSAKSTTKRVSCDWFFEMADFGLQVCIIDHPSSILVLGERNIYCLTDTGCLRFTKRLEYDPSCIMSYGCLTGHAVNYIVVSHSHSLLIYEDVTLKWAAKTDFTAIQCNVATVHNLNGVLVLLSDSGRLECAYLGTDPSTFSPPLPGCRELDRRRMDAEMAGLRQRMKELGQQPVITPGRHQDRVLQIVINISRNLDDVLSKATDMDVSGGDGGRTAPSIQLTIQVRSKLLVENLKLNIHIQWPLVVDQNQHTIASVEPSVPVEIHCTVSQQADALPTDLHVHITTVYHTATGVCRLVTSSARLPARLVLNPVLPVKSAAYKLTVETNQPTVNLNDVFPDMTDEHTDGQGSALGLRLHCGHTVTVLASRVSQRYRLQSNYLEAMWIPLRELVCRLRQHFARRNVNHFTVKLISPLPLSEYFALIDCHFDCRRKVGQTVDVLSQRSAQFRAIQRRLLIRFKDKNPASLNRLDTMLHTTLGEILALGEALEEIYKAQTVAANNLSSATYLLNFLICLWTDMSEEESKLLEGAISPVVYNGTDQGWQEVTDVGVSHLLRTVLRKSVKDGVATPGPITSLPDTEKLKKHVSLLCDRLGKGGRLLTSVSDRAGNSAKPPHLNMAAEDNEVDVGGAPAVESVINTHSPSGRLKQIAQETAVDEFAPLGIPAVDMTETGYEELKDTKNRTIMNLVPDLDNIDEADIEESC